MRILYGLSGRLTPIHAHIESITAALVLQVLSISPCLPKALGDVIGVISSRDEQSVSGCDWIAVSEDLD